jgi:hypothetical protein
VRRWSATFAVLIAVAMTLAALVIATRLLFELVAS